MQYEPPWAPMALRRALAWPVQTTGPRLIGSGLPHSTGMGLVRPTPGCEVSDTYEILRFLADPVEVTELERARASSSASSGCLASSVAMLPACLPACLPAARAAQRNPAPCGCSSTQPPARRSRPWAARVFASIFAARAMPSSPSSPAPAGARSSGTQVWCSASSSRTCRLARSKASASWSSAHAAGCLASSPRYAARRAPCSLTWTSTRTPCAAR
mmetsp:Transcript_17110/g.48883  ORF Transcript_17110/g.48883 Transcript_17110/m.48883 type:complete len:216 (-) Transcript_17110:302-949(-)